jgi:hypothetical protein
MTEITLRNKSRASGAASLCVGVIVQVTEQGRALVDFPGNRTGPIEARSIITALSKHDVSSHESIPVLLVFENGDRSLPIIIGFIHDTLYPPTPQDGVALTTEQLHEVILDGKKMVFDAREEIVLRCGKSSVTLRKDGKVVIKGTHLVSRSSGPNKIKGASVAIN